MGSPILHWLVVGSLVALGLLRSHPAHAESGTTGGGVENSSQAEDWFDKSWLNTRPTLLKPRSGSIRNLPRVNPDNAQVVPVTMVPALQSLVGKWLEINAWSSESATLECQVGQEGRVIEARWRGFSSEIHRLLFATTQNAYIHRVDNAGKHYQLAGGRADPVLRVSRRYESGSESEMWRLSSQDTLHVELWHTRAAPPPMIDDGRVSCGGPIVIQGHVFVRVTE